MSIQSSINQAVNGMMSMIMPMSLLKEQGKVKQIKAEQEALKKTNEELKTSNDELKTSNDELKTSNDELKTSNDELMTSNDELRKGYEKELELWDEILASSPVNMKDAASDFTEYILSNPYAAGDQMAGTAATQRVQAEQEKRNAQMKRLQKAFNNIGMGGNDNG